MKLLWNKCSCETSFFSSSSSGEEYLVPLCEGGSELSEERQLRGRRRGRELMTRPWSRPHLPERDTALVSTSLSPHPPPHVVDCVTWPQEVVGSALVMWPRGRHGVRCTHITHPGRRWEAHPPPSTPQTFSAKKRQTQDQRRPGLTGIKPQENTEGSVLDGSFKNATTSLHWNKTELFSVADGASRSDPVSIETQTVL